MCLRGSFILADYVHSTSKASPQASERFATEKLLNFEELFEF